jgi:hypothetical protein
MSDPRSQSEVHTFLVVELILMLIRFVGMCYFMRQAWLFSRVPIEKRDSFSIITFLFLALSMICLFLYRFIMILSIQMTQHSDDHEWFIDNKPVLQSIVFLLRPTLCYLFQNVALLFNIQRFLTIFFENNQLVKNSSQSLSIMLTEEKRMEMEADEINILKRLSTSG